MKRNFWFVIIALLLATTPLVIHSAGRGAPGMFPWRGGPGGHAGVAGLLQMFALADELEITNPQLLQLRLLFQKNCSRIKNSDSHKALAKGLLDSSMKEEDVKKIASEAAKSIEERIMTRFYLMQEVKKILTPEQIKKLEEMKKNHIGHAGHFMGKPGRMMSGHPGFFHGGPGMELPEPPAPDFDPENQMEIE